MSTSLIVGALLPLRDGSYSLIRQERKTGYYVSQAGEISVPVDAPREEHDKALGATMRKVREVMGSVSVECFVGIWTDSDIVYYDVSFWFDASQAARAIQMGQSQRQRTVWDCANDQPIPVYTNRL